MLQTAIPCAVMRGGTSKGLVFLAEDLPDDRATRDAVLLAAMGSPDPREIDGMGGSHPLTSKVAVVSPSPRGNADVEYLFLQVWPDRAEVSDNQNCGNMLAAVGPFAIERGLMAAGGPKSAAFAGTYADCLITSVKNPADTVAGPRNCHTPSTTLSVPASRPPSTKCRKNNGLPPEASHITSADSSSRVPPNTDSISVTLCCLVNGCRSNRCR